MASLYAHPLSLVVLVALTKCPHCGHTVLSVASHCPACSGTLGRTFLGMDHEGELAECRSCGHPVRSRTPACPQCGIPHPAGRRAPKAAVPLLMAALLGALGLALGRTTTDPEPLSPAPDTARPAPQSVETRPIQQAVETPPADPPAPPQAAPLVALAPDTTPGLLTRWVADWSNMRRGPSNEAPVVRVLPPGTMVRGSPSKWGWWAIQFRGDTVGYVAGALLSPRRPPGTL